jgi:hypothetical protein
MYIFVVSEFILILGRFYQFIQGATQLTPQRKLTCANSNNITGTIDSFLLSAFLIEFKHIKSTNPGRTREEQNE